MAEFFAELKRKHMYRVAAVYAVVAWLLLQIVNNIAPGLNLPNWVATSVIVLLAVGFPIALVFAWIQQLNTPVSADQSAAQAKITRLDFALVGAAILVIGIFAYQQFRSDGVASLPAQQAGVAAARSASLSPSGVSVAVLPFANVSADPEQEFFSDGITDEISGALAKIPDLRVVGRTSAFQYRTRNTDLRSIGQALNATHLIEGSVRKAGARVRITVQLTLAESGLQLWSENYDRELTDIFAIQEDIARAIASSLNMQLGLRPGENLISSREIDPELYQEFLRIRAQKRSNIGRTNDLKAIEQLEALLARAPNFAEAWAFLSGLYALTGGGELYQSLWVLPAEELRRQVPQAYEKAERAAQEAIRLDPTQVAAYATLAHLETGRNWTAAEDLLRKGFAIAPHDPNLLFELASLSLKTGRLMKALEAMREVQALEPLDPGANTFFAAALLANNQTDAALALMEAKPLGAPVRQSVLAPAYAMAGRFDKSADSILRMGQGRFGQLWGRATVEEAARLIRNAPQAVADPKALPPMHEWLNFVYAYVGAADRLLDFSERAYEANLFGEVRFMFTPAYAAARKSERFKTLMRKVGLVDYWRTRGWPDLCRPVGADDFECD